MLVLSRKSQEQIRIGDSIVVTVLAVKGNSVRIGIEAPKAVRIVRSELAPLEDAATVKETSKATPSIPAPAPAALPVEMSEEAEDVPGLSSPGHNRLAHLTMPLSQFVARPR